MSQPHHHGTMLPQETNFDNADQPGIAQPISQTEIEELMFGSDRSAGERLDRLREIRAELAARESGDWGGEDPASLLGEVDRAIEALSTDLDDANETGDFAALSAALESDPNDHSETLSPDDDALEALSDDDEDDVEGLSILDEEEWEEGDDFRPERGVH